MFTLIVLLVVAVVFGMVWTNLSRNARPRAKTGPDGASGKAPDMEVGSELSPAVGSDGGPQGPGRTSNGDDDDDDQYGVEQPDLMDEIPDIPGGPMPAAERPGGDESGSESGGGRQAVSGGAPEVLFKPTNKGLAQVTFEPDPRLTQEMAAEWGWEGFDEDLPLPVAVGDDEVVALVRNPQSLYVYWGTGGTGEQNLRAMLGDTAWAQTTPVLRVYDVTAETSAGQPAGTFFVIPVGENDDHWFINSEIEPGHRYAVSYERATPEGSYYLIAHSAPVTTPNAGPGEPTCGTSSGAWR